MKKFFSQNFFWDNLSKHFSRGTIIILSFHVCRPRARLLLVSNTFLKFLRLSRSLVDWRGGLYSWRCRTLLTLRSIKRLKESSPLFQVKPLLWTPVMGCKKNVVTFYFSKYEIYFSEMILKDNTMQWITWLGGRWRTQLTARRNVNCRTHEHRHFERTLRTEACLLCMSGSGSVYLLSRDLFSLALGFLRVYLE